MNLETKYYKFGGDTGINRYKNFEQLSSCLRYEGFTDELKRESYVEFQSETGETVFAVSSNGMHRYFLDNRDGKHYKIEKLSPLKMDKDSMWKIIRYQIVPDKGYVRDYEGEVTFNGLMNIALN